MSKRYAVTAGTPYTLLNTLNYVYNMIERGNKVDLFIRDIPSMSKFFLGLNNIHFFDNIYTFKLREKTRTVSYLLYAFRQGALPKIFLKEIIQEDIDLSSKDYHAITVTSGFDIEMALVRTFPQAKQIAIDDGLGSYVGDIIHDHHLRWFWRVLGRRTEIIKPDCLYVNNVKACHSTLTSDIRQLKKFDECGGEYITVVEQVFGSVEDDLYSQKRLVYLTQPVEEIGTSKAITEWVLGELDKKAKSRTVIRRHPRDKNKYNIDIVEDKNNILWEFICSKYIDDNKCLIGICSTAHVTPKIMYGQEPYIIFIYKMLQLNKESTEYKRFDEIAGLLRDLYEHKERVVIPNTQKEFEYYLEKYSNKPQLLIK